MKSAMKSLEANWCLDHLLLPHSGRLYTCSTHSNNRSVTGHCWTEFKYARGYTMVWKVSQAKPYYGDMLEWFMGIPNWKPVCDRRVNITGMLHAAPDYATPNPQPFNKDQFDMLHKLLSQAIPLLHTSNLNSSIIGTLSVAHKGISSIALLSQHRLTNVWIVDYGASEWNLSILRSYCPCTTLSSLHIEMGLMQGYLAPGQPLFLTLLNFHSVVYVPNLDFNLPSVNRLDRDLKCTTHFSQDSCNFQDLASGNTVQGCIS